MTEFAPIKIQLGAIPAELASGRGGKHIYDLVGREAIKAAGAYLGRQLAINTPKGATGKARQSVNVTPDMSHDASGHLHGFVGYGEPASGYIAFVEEGTRPHFPPIEPLAYWAMRKFSLSPAAAESRGYLVARAIARRGTRPQRFIERTVRENGERAAIVAQGAASRAIAGYQAGTMR